MSALASAWAWQQPTRTPGAKLLLMKLAEQANDDGITWPAITTLSAHLGVSDRTVQNWRKELEELGLIKSRVRRRQNGSRTSNVYQLLMPHVDGERADREDGERGFTPRSSEARSRTSQKEERPAAAARARARTPRDELWDALVEATGIEPATTGEKSRFGKSVNELLAAGATPSEVKARAKRWPMKYPGAALTDRALANRWGELAGKRAGLAEEPCPECDLRFTPKKLRDHRYTIHGVGKICAECTEVVLEGEEHACRAR